MFSCTMSTSAARRPKVHGTLFRKKRDMVRNAAPNSVNGCITMSALWVALWTVAVQLKDALNLIFDQGFCYFFKYLLASFRLAYKHSTRSKVFELCDVSKAVEPSHMNIVSTQREWEKECPSPSDALVKNEDSFFLYGVNSTGHKLLLYFSRLKNSIAELWMCLYAADGTRYVLPCGFTLDRSDQNSFAGKGLKIQCLAPARRWRIAFNGLLRKSTTEDNDLDGPEVHVKFGFIWTPVSHTLEYPVEISPVLMAEEFAKLPLVKMLWQIEQFGTDIDAYDQAGMMTGEVFIDGKRTEIQLWGSRVRSKGVLSYAPGSEDHHFGFLEDGKIYHLVHTHDYAGSEGLFYGSMYLPNQRMLPIDYCLVRTKELKYGKPLRLYISAGSEDNPIHVSHIDKTLTFTTEDSSKEFQVVANRLVSGDINGNGITVRIEKKGPTTYRIPEHYRQLVTSTPQSDVSVEHPLGIGIEQQICRRPELTGGKGSSLALLHSISERKRMFTVPRAFVITTRAYSVFSSSAQFQQLVKEVTVSQTSGGSLSQLKDTCKRVVQSMAKLPLQEVIKDEVVECLQKFGSDYEKRTFAVRSSAVGEDSEETSAAGQMQTFLGVRGTSKIFESIVRCWASQFNFAAVNYKRQYGQLVNSPMAVVIQEMVPASVAGVMFTCDPVTGDPSYIAVTANYGLGESVVSASAEPDTFLLKRTDGMRPVLHSVQLGQKSVYMTESETEGVLMQPVSEEKTKQKCMTDEQVEQLAFIGTQIERCFSAPCDIEWAIHQGKYYLLQLRPVSSILKETDYELIHEFDTGLKSEKELFTKANVSEVFPGALTPLGFGIIRLCFDTLAREATTRLVPSIPKDSTFYAPLFVPVCRHSVFVWLSGLQRPRGEDMMAKAMLYSTMGRDISTDPLTKESVKRGVATDPKRIPTTALQILKMLFTVQKQLDAVTRFSKSYNLSMDGLSTSQQMYRRIGSNLRFLAKPSTALIEAFSASSLYNLVILRILIAAKGDMTPQILVDFSKMLRGCDTESADVPNSILELGNLLRKSEDRDRFLTMSVEDATAWLKTTDSMCGVKFREFLEKHGHRNVKEFDVYTKPWGMEPSSLIASLKAAATAPSTTENRTTAEWTLDNLSYNLTIFQRLLLNFLLPRARTAVAGRETAKSATVRMIHKFRVAFIQLANQMVREGRIPEPDILFFMTFEEIGQLLETRSPTIAAKASRRFRLHAELNKDRYPNLMVGVPKPIERELKYIEGETELKGSPMSQGIARGYARVVRDFEEAHLIKKGDILITTATDTGWTPYFPLLGGVVTEIGGPLSHGAVVAREYGLPCVVGIDDATSLLRTGDYVLLDGNTGSLRRVQKPQDDEGELHDVFQGTPRLQGHL
ncbi:rifampicin phosphotransferase-like [Ornithodoros turicata]|uniref:rifampicin phosphotransferase-like n=1 Tax=Ornithodoros turicata TaxID=34597 RepID=UPI00313A16C7